MTPEQEKFIAEKVKEFVALQATETAKTIPDYCVFLAQALEEAIEVGEKTHGENPRQETPNY